MIEEKIGSGDKATRSCRVIGSRKRPGKNKTEKSSDVQYSPHQLACFAHKLTLRGPTDSMYRMLVSRWMRRWTVEDDYGMEDGTLRVKTRAALAGYVLRRWGIDSSDDHRLDPASHHLWLRNPQTLYGVESASLAPGRDAVQKVRQ
jgi:hypothetical protein